MEQNVDETMPTQPAIEDMEIGRLITLHYPHTLYERKIWSKC